MGQGAALLLCLCLLPGCRQRSPEPEPPEPAPPQRPFEPQIHARGITWTLPDPQGRPIWELEASEGGGAASQGLAELQDVRCRVYAEGKLALNAEAARVRADLKAKRLALQGGVSAKTVDGKRSFRCQQVTLSVKEEKRAVVEATGTVRLQVDGLEMAGARLVTNPRLSEGQLLPEE
jgi:LPS export ABC transporter protein LptC